MHSFVEHSVELFASAVASVWVLTSVTGVGGWIWLTMRPDPRRKPRPPA